MTVNPIRTRLVLILVASLLASTVWAKRDRAPGFAEQSLELPGMPAAIIPADMNGDGVDDLLVLVAYTAWNEVAETERVEFTGIEGLVEVMNVVSSLVDRRELRVYPGRADGYGFDPHLSPLELDTSVHALDTGGPTEPLLAITDHGVAAVRLRGAGDESRLELVPILEAESSFTGTGTFFSDFDFLHDLDGDGRSDVLLPSVDGWRVFQGTPSGLAQVPSSLLVVPPSASDDGDDDSDSDSEDSESDSDDSDDSDDERKRPRRPRQPQVKDVNGDGLPDLVVFKADRGRAPLVYLNETKEGRLAFAPGAEVNLPDSNTDEEIVYIGDLDTDGRAVVVAAEELEPGNDAGIRAEIRHAKKPDFQYRIYPLRPSLAPATEPQLDFKAEGYTFGGDDGDDDDEDVDIRLPGGFQDLDGDGRQDLVAITLDFSVLPMLLRVLVLRSISLRMDFHPYCQLEDGTLRRVPNLDLSGKFKLNLRNVQVKHLSQFQGDFNGDGRADFVQLGRGKRVTIHQGGPGCTYPVRPDRQILLDREPQHLGLTRIVDLDSNGRSDLYVVHPLKSKETGESVPARVDIYLAEE